MEFALDATFFAFVGLVLFLALVVYLKVPGMPVLPGLAT